MPVPHLDIASTVSDGLGRQHLREDARATNVVQIARDLVGLHATGAPNPYLQLRERIPGFARSMLDRELYERSSLVRSAACAARCSPCRSTCCRSRGRRLGIWC